MKKYLSIVILLLFVTISTQAQEFVAPTRTSVAFKDTTTTYTYKMTDKTYKVFKSKSGAFYIWKVSKKTSKPYKMYLPKEIQIKMGRKYEK